MKRLNKNYIFFIFNKTCHLELKMKATSGEFFTEYFTEKQTLVVCDKVLSLIYSVSSPPSWTDSSNIFYFTLFIECHLQSFIEVPASLISPEHIFHSTACSRFTNIELI